MYRAANIPEGLARFEGRYREVRRVCLTLLEAILPPFLNPWMQLPHYWRPGSIGGHWHIPYRMESCNRRKKYVKRDR